MLSDMPVMRTKVMLAKSVAAFLQISIFIKDFPNFLHFLLIFLKNASHVHGFRDHRKIFIFELSGKIDNVYNQKLFRFVLFIFFFY